MRTTLGAEGEKPFVYGVGQRGKGIAVGQGGTGDGQSEFSGHGVSEKVVVENRKQDNERSPLHITQNGGICHACMSEGVYTDGLC